MLPVNTKQLWCILTLCAVSFPLIPKLAAAEPAISWETLAKYSADGLQVSAVQVTAEDKPTILLQYTRANLQDQTSADSLEVRYIVVVDNEATIDSAWICWGGPSSRVIVKLGGTDVDVENALEVGPESGISDYFSFSFPKNYIEEHPLPDLDAGRLFRISLEDSRRLIMKQLKVSAAAKEQLLSIVRKKQGEDIFEWWAEHENSAQVKNTWKVDPDTALSEQKKPR